MIQSRASSEHGTRFSAGTALPIFARTTGVCGALLLLAGGCALASGGAMPRPLDETFDRALENGRLANEAFVRSQRVVDGWMEHTDPRTGLLPRNLFEGRDIWNAHDTAADLYPFFVLTTFFTDRADYDGRMQEILLTEAALTSRVGRMPDIYSFSKRDFQEPEPNLDRVIFGASEYVKDGLMAITEWLGESPWRARMIGILDDIWDYAPLETAYGRIPSNNPEVNGELLQVTSRVFWMTGDRKYLELATRIGDYYLLGGHHPTRDSELLRLRDHGNEVVSGLTELYATVHRVDPERAARYREPMHAMLNRILEAGRNEHGLFYNAFNPRASEPTDLRLADNFGYILNGFYTVYLLDGTEAYRQATRTALSALDPHYPDYDWENGGADGDADAVEGALNLYNREPIASTARWIDRQTRTMWSKQDSAYRPEALIFKGAGVVEGRHPDGNFNRTSLMYALWKTAGTSAHPWRPDLVFGAVQQGESLRLVVRAEDAWSGELRFDVPRHRIHLGMPVDWPRMNQFPEWFTVEAERRYQVHDLMRETRSVHTGAALRRGLPLELQRNQELRLIVTPL